jgi:hypothetical protein
MQSEYEQAPAIQCELLHQLQAVPYRNALIRVVECNFNNGSIHHTTLPTMIEQLQHPVSTTTTEQQPNNNMMALCSELIPRTRVEPAFHHSIQSELLHGG